VARIDPSLLLAPGSGTDSSVMRAGVKSAREFAIGRGLGATSCLSGAQLLKACALDRSARGCLEATARLQRLSGRGVTRLLRVARTAADLEGSARVSKEHISEMLGYRAKEES
jgi:magnesium chelatase family protein